jgi:hypothetical protein
MPSSGFPAANRGWRFANTRKLDVSAFGQMRHWPRPSSLCGSRLSLSMDER